MKKIGRSRTQPTTAAIHGRVLCSFLAAPMPRTNRATRAAATWPKNQSQTECDHNQESLCERVDLNRLVIIVAPAAGAIADKFCRLFGLCLWHQS